MAKLTPKQKLFCKEYIIDWNATRAAKDAGYSEKTAFVIGYENLKKPYIVEQIAAELKAREERTEIKADDVIKELAILGFSDLQNYTSIGEDGQIIIKQFEEMPPGKSRAVESISEERIIRETPDGKQIIVHDRIKYKLHSKLKALELLFKHFGLGAEERFKFALEGTDGQPIEFEITYVNTNGASAGSDKDEEEDSS